MSDPDDNMWARWYMLPLDKRRALIKLYGGEWAAAYALFGGG